MSSIYIIMIINYHLTLTTEAKMPYFIIFIAIIVVIGFYFVSIYNSLVGLRNRVKNAWSQIDVQLKRRHDLIPNLLGSSKGIYETRT